MNAGRPPRSTVFRFLPFLFLGVLFVGHGAGAIIASLAISIVLSVGISLLLRRRPPRDDGFLVSFPSTSSGLEGTLSVGRDGARWVPHRPTMPPWFVSWREVVGIRVLDRGTVSDLELDLAGAETMRISVEADRLTVESALAHARGVGTV